MSVKDEIKEKNEEEEQEIDTVPLYKKKSAWIGLLLILIVVAIGAYWFISSLGYVTSDDAYIDGNRLNVSSKILGRVVKLYVDERDSVKAGQLVAELDSTDFVAQLNQMKANLNNAQVSIDLSKVNVEKAEINYKRAESQYKDKVIPKADYDNAQKGLEAAQAEYKIARSRIVMAQSEIKVMESNLKNTKLYSTINGVVAKRWILAGDVVQPGQPLFTIYDLKNIWVTVQLQETYISNIQLNDEVEITVDSYPEQKFSGRIYEVGTNTAAQFALIPPSNASGNFTKVTQRIPIKITIEQDNTNKALRYGLLPGMSVEVKIKEKSNG